MPKIVKTSQDHGNMFFIQQANSLKNSSQISQRKDLNKFSSHGGLTSATTAVGNHEVFSNGHENRSRNSRHDQGAIESHAVNNGVFSGN
jgi:hypothetical protein